MSKSSSSEYLTAAQVCARFGNASQMWLHRRLTHDDFPAPVSFGGRYRHFKLSDIETWEAKMIARAISVDRAKRRKQVTAATQESDKKHSKRDASMFSETLLLKRKG